MRGNWIAATGMGLAVVATLISVRDTAMINWILIAAGLIIGVVLGVPPAKKTKMTAMPQLVALFNGVGGGTVALIAWAEFIETDGFRPSSTTRPDGRTGRRFAVRGDHRLGVVLGFAGRVPETAGVDPKNVEKALVRLGQAVPGRQHRAAARRGRRGGRTSACTPGTATRRWLIVLVLVLAGIMGLFVVFPIGGADMPVVISLLNAMTGLSAAAAGLALNNTAMIVAGMIVGASGSILTNLMAMAMNRSIPAIVFGSLRRRRRPRPAAGGGDQGTVKATSAADAAIQMAYANQVIVVPGYGLAVAQAQHAVKDMASLLEAKGVEVKYAIHPVAGRMPGHMNVLLAEADVDYDAMKEMDDINGEFARTDVTIVIGANDVTNPAARNDPSSARSTACRSSTSTSPARSSCSSGRCTPASPASRTRCSSLDHTSMLFGDAKKSVGEVTEELKAL